MFFQQAYEGRNQWWRWLVTTVTTVLLWLVGHIPLIIFVNREAARLGLSDLDISTLVADPDLDRNLFLLLALIPFVLGFATLRFLIRRMHKRSLRSVMTGRPRFDWRRASLGFAVWFLLIGAATFALLPSASYSYQVSSSTFWPLLAIGLLLIPIQTTFEEVFFRGYLAQGIALLFKNKLAALIIVALIFTSVHAANPEFYSDYANGLIIYLAVSLFFGMVAVMDDGLEVPCGIHAANNVFAAVILSTKDGSFVTNSVFVSTVRETMQFSPYIDVGLCVIGLFIFYYMFGWRFSTLLEPTEPTARNDAVKERNSEADTVVVEC